MPFGSAACAQLTLCKDFGLIPFPQMPTLFLLALRHTGEGIFSISFKEAKLFESFEITHRLGLVITNVELANDRKKSASVLNTKCCT